jgi:hypothetical protein
MLQKIKNNLVVVVMVLMSFAPVAVPAFANADQVCGNGSIGDSIASGASQAAGGSSFTCSGTTGVGINNLASIGHTVVNYFSILIGVVAVIMIIVGGFRYITSGGDSGKVGSAKNTLIYAIIGLVIVALAQIIVHFVLSTTNNAVQ